MSYSFDTVQNVGVVVAPHTEYKGTTLKDMNAEPLIEKLDPTMFVQPSAWLGERGATMDIDMMIGFARQMSTLVEFATPKEANQLKQDLNAYIRDGDEVVRRSSQIISWCGCGYWLKVLRLSAWNL